MLSRLARPALRSASTTPGSSPTMSKAVPSGHPKRPLSLSAQEKGEGSLPILVPLTLAAPTTGNATTPTALPVTATGAAFSPLGHQFESRSTPRATPKLTEATRPR